MATPTNLLIQSKYFLPIFNMAIFDGPFRLYFAQSQEAEALRMYFELHEILGERIRPPRSGVTTDKALFVLMYPDEKSFVEAFGMVEPIAEGNVGDCIVTGVCGPVWDASALSQIISRIEQIFDASGPADSRPLFSEL